MAGTDRTKQDTVAAANSGPAVILVAPQLGENVGTAARAMLNFGLTDLRLVKARDGWPNAWAEKASSGALEEGVRVRLFDRTEDAITDLERVYATTARDRDLIKPVMTPQTAIAESRGLEASGARVGVLFGGERSGLNNDDVSLAHAILTVPVNPRFASINLAQAVLLVSYEWYQNRIDAPQERLETGDSDIAGKDELLNFLTRLESALDQGGFFKSPGLRPTTVRNIRNMFQRAGLTSQEVSTFHGIVESLKRAGRRAGRKDELKD